MASSNNVARDLIRSYMHGDASRCAPAPHLSVQRSQQRRQWRPSEPARAAARFSAWLKILMDGISRCD
eukprot:6189261-Pleurochrysis_carterae.AAC.2